MTRLVYRPEVDGLRCLAVMVVIFVHVGFTRFGGGVEQALYFDDNHLSITGALRLADFMLARMPAGEQQR